MMLEFKLTASSIVPPWATGTYPSKYHLQLSAALTLRKQGVHRLVDRICDFLSSLIAKDRRESTLRPVVLPTGVAPACLTAAGLESAMSADSITGA